MQTLKVIFIVLEVLVLFNLLIFVHELGHFLAARWRGLKVERFAIWFGHPIWKMKRDDVEYVLGWIPAGGYVKLPQMITSEALEGSAETAEKIPPASPLSKILVAIAGPFMNVVFAFVIATLLYFVGIPVRVNPSIIGYVDPASAEGKLGIVAGDRITVSALHRYEGCRLGYRFEGTVKDGSMSGEVVLGTGGEAHQGPVNLAQYGKTTFAAKRVAG